ncbi:dihydroorotase [Bacillus sp. 2205SS5-2]|uniref:dihydroorotase n=1 Tax=Bacillus sp. 2205SS5-2 TaxID=3109031 RepID=UPI003005E646
MNWFIQNATLVNKQNETIPTNLRIENGVIKEIGPDLIPEEEQIWEARGRLLSPGFVDLHVHLREPGGEKKETIQTGTLAAAKGGFTTIAAMPNTRPVPDSVEHLESLQKKINEDAHIRVLPYAAITERQLGVSLTDFSALKNRGAFAFTDDGVGVQDANLMLQAMTQAASVSASIVAHCEENTLIHAGAVHEGKFSTRTGIPGIPSVCESVQIARDVLLAEATGCHYHVCHISTKASVRVVRDAKKAGIPVSAEVTPHHLLLSEEDIPGDDANYKMNPPLRSKGDQEALIEGILDGTIDFIATDHAPHTEGEKKEGILLGPFGIVGLETAFPLLYTSFVKRGIFTLKQLVDWLTVRPAEAFKLPYGTIEVGGIADFTLIDLETEKKVDPTKFVSKGKNTPFTGISCQGWPVATWSNGNLVWKDELA